MDIKIPFDVCGQDIGPSVTGNAIVQHLVKLRKKVQLEDSQTVPKRVKATARMIPKNSDSMDEGSSDDSYAPKGKETKMTMIAKSNVGLNKPTHQEKAESSSNVHPKVSHVSLAIQGGSTSLTSPRQKRSHDLIGQESEEDEDDEEYVAAGSKFLEYDEEGDFADEDVGDLIIGSSASEVKPGFGGDGTRNDITKVIVIKFRGEGKVAFGQLVHANESSPTEVISVPKASTKYRFVV